MNTKYLLGAILAVPLLPVMYFQGKRIKASVPNLPEAKGTEGIAVANPEGSMKLITIGESTIAGVGVETHEEGFTGTLAKELAKKLDANVHWKVYAKSGYTVKKVQERIIPKVSETSVDLIVIGMGGNDAFTLNNPKKWRLHIRELINEIRTKFPDTPIAFTNMPPIKEFPAFTPVIKFTIGNLVEILGEELNDLVQDQKGVYYYALKITLKDWLERLQIDGKPADFFSDGVHPSKLTYQVWARDFANFLMKQPEIRKKLRMD